MSASITSVQNPRVKEAVKLRDRRGRDDQGRIIIDGIREMTRALDAGVKMEEVFFQAADYGNDEVWEIVRRAEEAGAEGLAVSAPVFEKIAFGERTASVVGVAKTPRPELDQLKLPDSPLIAVLEGIEKPGNVGAVLRSADGAGVSAVIIADGGTDLYNPNTIRASMGTLFSLPVCAATSNAVRSWLQENQVSVFAARVDATTSYTEANFKGAVAIVLGSETDGVSRAWSGNDITGIKLPMNGVADSLNVSATAAVLFYEALRQRVS